MSESGNGNISLHKVLLQSVIQSFMYPPDASSGYHYVHLCTQLASENLNNVPTYFTEENVFFLNLKTMSWTVSSFVFIICFTQIISILIKVNKVKEENYDILKITNL